MLSKYPYTLRPTSLRPSSLIPLSMILLTTTWWRRHWLQGQTTLYRNISWLDTWMDCSCRSQFYWRGLFLHIYCYLRTLKGPVDLLPICFHRLEASIARRCFLLCQHCPLANLPRFSLVSSDLNYSKSVWASSSVSNCLYFYTAVERTHEAITRQGNGTKVRLIMEENVIYVTFSDSWI